MNIVSDISEVYNGINKEFLYTAFLAGTKTNRYF